MAPFQLVLGFLSIGSTLLVNQGEVTSLRVTERQRRVNNNQTLLCSNDDLNQQKEGQCM